MAGHEWTADFRALLNEKGVPGKRVGQGSEDVFLQGCLSTASSQREKEALTQRRKADREWILEARRIYRSIISLVSFLSTTRRAYLAQSGIGRPQSATQDDEETQKLEADDPLARWKRMRQMDDRQRDELDFQVRIMLKRCMEQIKELEKAEEIRKRTSPTSHTSTNPISFLRALSSSTNSVYSAAYSEQLALHRSSICHHLSSLLAETGNRQRDMQERRLRVKKNKELKEAGVKAQASSRSNGSSAAAKAVQGSTRTIKMDAAVAPLLEEEAKEAKAYDVLSSLSPEQIQQFESENSALLQSLENDLASVQQAESKLYAISELQTQLIQHLGQQAEMTDRLLEESVNHTSEVGQGNAQLRKAKERSREANKFLSIFLVGSGLGLLFLHWMD